MLQNLSEISMKNRAAILGIATALPKTEISALAYGTFITNLLRFDEKTTAIVNRIIKNAQIQKRHSIISDFVKDPMEWTFFNAAQPKIFPTTQARNNLYKQEALPLSCVAAKKVLVQSNVPAECITHIIYVSCTGLMAPGIECLMIEALGLKPTTQRYALNFMGCFGAFRALALAQALVAQSVENRILIICTELCSLHFQPDLKLDTIIGNALFADGSAALIVGGHLRVGEKAYWQIVQTASAVIEKSPMAMTWDVSDSGFVMRLSPEIPKHLQSKIAQFSTALIGHHDDPRSIDWVVHPGGKAIIQAIEQSCGLRPWQTQSSWNVLRNYGNMSSATIPFVLYDLMHSARKEWAIALGFGPGLSIEGLLLKRGSDA